MATATKKATPRTDTTGDRGAGLRRLASQYFGRSQLANDRLSFERDLTSFETKKKMRRDPVIALGMWTIKAPVASADFTVQCIDPVIRAFVRHNLRPLWERLLRSCLLSLDFGWQPHELVWELRDVHLSVDDYTSKDPGAVRSEQLLEKMVVLKAVKDLNVSTTRPVYDPAADEFIGIEQDNAIGPAVFIPADKLLVVTNEMEWGNYLGRSLLDNAYRPWYYGYMIEQMWSRYMESRAIPPVIGTGPIGTRINSETGESYRIEDVVLTVINNLQGGAGGYLPFEPDAITRKNMWGIEPVTFPQSADQFESYMAKNDAMKLRALLIPEKAVIQGSKVGTMSETSQFTDTFMVGLDRMIKSLESVINDQLIPRIVAMNFTNAPPCSLIISELTSQRRTALRDFASILGQASATNTHGIRYTFPDLIDLENLSRQFGIPIRDPDSILTPSVDPNAAKDDGTNDSPEPDKRRGRSNL